MIGRQLRHTLALALLLVPVCGCSGWHADPGLGPTALVEQRHPSRVRLELRSGRRVELREPFVRGDTLVGRVGRDTVRVAGADVVAAARRRFSLGRTMVRVGIGAGALFGLAAIGCAMDPCGFSAY